MKLGRNGVLPFRLGGGLAPHEVAYNAMRAALGDGGTARPGTIIEAWRVARARGLASVIQDRRATLQAFPHTATDGIESFLQRMAILVPHDATEQEIRDTVTSAWAETAGSIHSELLAALQAIDSRFSIVTQSHDVTRDTTSGRGFQDFTPGDPAASGPAYNTGFIGTQFPNYSDEFIERVWFNVGADPSPSDMTKIALAKQLLQRRLPAWMDFQIYIDDAGFVLDEDLLDVTAFGH